MPSIFDLEPLVVRPVPAPLSVFDAVACDAIPIERLSLRSWDPHACQPGSAGDWDRDFSQILSDLERVVLTEFRRQQDENKRLRERLLHNADPEDSESFNRQVTPIIVSDPFLPIAPAPPPLGSMTTQSSIGTPSVTPYHSEGGTRRRSALTTGISQHGMFFESESSTGNRRKSPSTLTQSVGFECWALWNEHEWISETEAAHVKPEASVSQWTMQSVEPEIVERSRSIMLSPSSPLCVSWDCLLLLVILWDCVMVPLQLVETPEEPWIHVADWVTLIFWTLTIPMSFFRGFMCKDGHIEQRPRRVAYNYVTTWFVFDVALVTVDWLDRAAKGYDVARTMRILKTSRSLRVMRMFRIARIIKLPVIVNQFTGKSTRTGKILRLLLNVILISGCFLLVSHVIACGWYAVGKSERHDDKGWIKTANVESASFSTRYSYALHWALTQFAGDEVVSPGTDRERWYAIVILVFAYVASAGFISGITAALTQVYIISSRKNTQFAALTRYLRQQTISPSLALRVTQSARYAMIKKEKNMTEQEVELLSLVTAPLRAEIHFEVFSPILTSHPFFGCYQRNSEVVVQKICTNACQELLLSISDLLFSEGETSANPFMYFIRTGQVLYFKRGMRKPIGKSNGWFCEAALWCKWVHLGACKAGDNSTLLAVESTKFQKVAQEYQGSIYYPAIYAQQFVANLNDHDVGSLDDLACGHFDACDLLSRWNFKEARTLSPMPWGAFLPAWSTGSREN